MDVFNSIIELVKALPDLAIWILVIFYGFKVVVVGSIYGVIRFVVDRLATAYEAHRIVTPVRMLKVNKDSADLIVCVTDAEITRLIKAASRNGSGLHQSDIDSAIDAINATKK